MKLEIRNETNKKLYVSLCKTTILGNLFLHIDNKKSRHIPILVKPKSYEIIKEKEVLA